MAEWVSVGDNFIAADVVRWKEAVFKARRSKKGRAVKLGERLVIAEVLRDEAGWVYLLVRGCELVSVKTGWLDRHVPLLPTGTETKRKRKTIARGNAEWLLWSDESARALLASRFFGNHQPSSPEPKGDSKS